MLAWRFSVRNRQFLNESAHRLGDCRGSLTSRIRQNHGELFPAIPGNNVGGPQNRASEGLHDFNEAVVSGLVSIRIVHNFEVVDIDHNQRNRRRIAKSPAHFDLEHLIEPPPVGGASQRVFDGDAVQALVDFLQFFGFGRHVLCGAPQSRRMLQTPK